MDLFSQIENPEREEILALRKELEQANYQYYVLNAPTMSDYDFDQKLRRLQDLEALHPDMFDPNSPTQHVGSDIVNEDNVAEQHTTQQREAHNVQSTSNAKHITRSPKGFAQVAHKYPMLSLSNSFRERRLPTGLANCQQTWKLCVS